MNWDYVAGFFDGEGNVCTPSAAADRSIPAPKILLAQSGSVGRAVLAEMAEFLLESGIKSKLYSRPKVKEHHAVTWTLAINARPSVERFLRSMSGRVRVKKVVVEDTLRFLIAFPALKPRKVA